MVQQVTIPFSELNTFLPGQPLEDVEFTVPTLDDIDQSIRDAVLDPSDIQTAAEEGLLAALEDATPLDELADLIVDPIVRELEAELGVDFPDPEALIDEFLEAVDLDDLGPIEVDIEGSLFDVEQDLVTLLAEALDEAGLPTPEFPDLLEEAETAVRDALPVAAPEAEDALETAVLALTEFSGDVRAFIEDPVGTATGWTMTLARSVVEEADLVSEETREATEGFNQ